MPRVRRRTRNAALSYPVSVTSLRGRVFGRPVRWGTRTRSSVSSARRTSNVCALVRFAASGSPCPSVTSIHFVPVPRFVSPTPDPPCSRGRSSRRGTPAPMRVSRARRAWTARLPRSGSRFRPLPRISTVASRSWRFRIATEGRPTGTRS